MEIILGILGIIICLPLAVVFGILAFYLIFIFFVGVACIPMAIVQRIAGKSIDEEENDKDEE